ncbi:RNA polymerase sporulation sigma factor SigH [Virgibacillus sp. W0430]|uniref:RNA polymerase sporulation sigma factor SigH n=1 Tax=Virgibacillus sp. W0430 TaxID=3391580 RepID=UPI003F45BCC0
MVAVNSIRKVDVCFRSMMDEEIIHMVKQGNKLALDYLIEKYKNFVHAKAQTYFLIGSDREDVIQEGMIGLYKAVRDYDGDKLASFKRFAELCIKRQIITSIKTATRQKHIPLNSYVSLDKPIYDEESERTLLDVIAGSRAIDPQELLINREKFTFLEGKLSESLSDLEKNVLHLYLEGCSYEEISEQLNRHIKSVDNALQRVKRKLEQFTESKELVL